MQKKKDFVFLIISIVSFLILSISFLIMPIETNVGSGSVGAATIAAGTMFWAGLITGIVMQVLLSVSRKKWLAANNKIRRGIKGEPSLGMFSFFKNKIAMAFDISAFVGLAGLIISMIATNAAGYICYVFIALFIFSLCSHCIFNGKNYFYIMNKEKMSNDAAQKKQKSGLKGEN